MLAADRFCILLRGTAYDNGRPLMPTADRFCLFERATAYSSGRPLIDPPRATVRTLRLSQDDLAPHVCLGEARTMRVSTSSLMPKPLGGMFVRLGPCCLSTKKLPTTLPSEFLLQPGLGLHRRLHLGLAAVAAELDGMILAGAGLARPAHDLRPRVLIAPSGTLRAIVDLGLFNCLH